ncbi:MULTISPECIES: DEAD/DEAH box helicase family protein [unclassified Butyricimonas]|uniref:DEAD/DEAH box helicase family protein n=1 Tax=unclassified Butyricimonas TaxID=2637652 RepID=UPI000C079214|nr:MULTISPECIES: DEAD/DEAH box helicase family protein [unclassified Butyricimonas]
MKPEEKARVKIDQMFLDAGWAIVDRDHYAPNITAVAIKEGLLKGNLEADYFLFINGKAVGILEAKREETNVSSNIVCQQATLYVRSVPNCYQTYENPLPLIYQSNGNVVLFRDHRNKNSDYIELNRIHTPKEIVKMLGIKDFYAGLPILRKKGLRDCQYEAITELEKSFRSGQNRALMNLATGAGKTYTACLAAYRFLAYTPMKRILFLVDRNNLGKQAEGEFGRFRLTENGDPFNTIFTVNRLHSPKVPQDSNVVISTIQRLFSLLKGEDIEDTDNDEEYDETSEIELPRNPNLPPDFFDMIIIDECHRSIYGNWKKVLDYFNTAKLVGLTATPAPETKAFFNSNIIVNYTLEESIVDGVNVDCRIYRIKTKATEEGGAILEGDKLKRATVYTGKIEDISNKETKNYTKEELNRSIINPAQIKLVLETYRDAVYPEMFNDPPREANIDYLPKTLIFALNENHATNIVRIAKEVFGHENDDTFVQKITYSSGDSNELIRQFRNDKEFRIAVTCTLVATGTDVKPLEVVLFMRDVISEPLYIQMKGRGVRTIGDEQLRNVTPNAFSKDCFFLVDAVGVTEHDKKITPPSEGATTKLITFKELLEHIAHGNVNDGNLRLLASRLSRIYNKSDQSQRTKFMNLAHTDMKDISNNIYIALEQASLPPYMDINEPNIERKKLVANIANYPEAREYLLILNAGFVFTLQPGEDKLISTGFSVEEAQSMTSAFEQYCNEHKDEVEALRLIYNNDGSPITYSLLKDLENRLRIANNKFSQSQLWNSYTILNPNSVKTRSTKEEKDALTNIIQLIRYAYHQIDRLESLYPTAQQRFNLWYGQTQRNITDKQIEIIRQIVNYIASNGACNIKDIREDDKTRAAQLIKAFGGVAAADEALISLSKFIIYRKIA